MKKLSLLLSVILVVSMLFTACNSSKKENESSESVSETQASETQKKENDFYELVSKTQELLDIVADDIYSYWYDCIYEDKYLENITYAVQCALQDNKDNLNKIEANTSQIKGLYKEVKDGDLKAEVKAVMQAYNDYYTFVVEVSGSFESYKKNKENYKKELASALRNLSFELD